MPTHIFFSNYLLTLKSLKQENEFVYNIFIKANFYWRDYDGTIPSDAVPGGNLNGNITYIGMLTVPGIINAGTISGFIIPGDPKAYATHHGLALENDKGVRVPCRFMWTKKLEDNCVYVTGSYSDTPATYIGRATYEGNVVIGRVDFN
ncbi:hypothetical protein RI129_010752 [Pyrocoelia pectoralis]|uniref:Uncharacterized protein n=1 Tax=Pyrocoelia pectoralis TaxID=417401 RepID=A0AAN7V6U3_9COLE